MAELTMGIDWSDNKYAEMENLARNFVINRKVACSSAKKVLLLGTFHFCTDKYLAFALSVFGL